MYFFFLPFLLVRCTCQLVYAKLTPGACRCLLVRARYLSAVPHQKMFCVWCGAGDVAPADLFGLVWVCFGLAVGLAVGLVWFGGCFGLLGLVLGLFGLVWRLV